MTWTQTVLARFEGGDISREIALAQLLLSGEVPDPDTLPAPLAELARTHQAQLAPLAALAKRGFDGDNTADVAALFDRLATEAPEAGVAFYSFGDPALLADATAELVATIRAWAPLAGREVLDFGCGIGRVAIALAPEAGRVTGVDLSTGMIAQARVRADGLANVDFVQTHDATLPFADAAFDLVVAVDSFPFLVQAGEAVVDAQLAEFARVVRPGAPLMVFNWSYRGDDDRDIADARALADRHGFDTITAGARPFRIWDGRGFHFRRR